MTLPGLLVMRWVVAAPKGSFWAVGKEWRKPMTYRCPKCGYLESYAK